MKNATLLILSFAVLSFSSSGWSAPNKENQSSSCVAVKDDSLKSLKCVVQEKNLGAKLDLSFQTWFVPDEFSNLVKKIFVYDKSALKPLATLTPGEDDQDTFGPDEEPITFADANFDGVLDVTARSSNTARGQNSYDFWIVEPKTKTFVYQKELSENCCDPSFDVKDKTVHFSSHSYTEATETIMKWEAGKLKRVSDKEFLIEPSDASFDCTKDLKQYSPTELQICKDADLGKLDARLATAFANALAKAKHSGAAVLKKSQTAWLKARNKECGDNTDCIETKYKARLKELE